MMYSRYDDIERFISGKQVVKVSMPTVSSKGEIQDEEQNSILDADSEIKKPDISNSLSGDSHSVQPIPNLVTLALLPKTQWQSLINLDVIMMRNKPVEPPKKPEKAPFFLPSLPSVSGEMIFVPGSTNENGAEKEIENDDIVSRSQNKRGKDFSESHFMRLLESCRESNDFTRFTDYLKSLSPSAVDIELRMLQIVDESIMETEHSEKLQGIEMLLDYFVNEMSRKTNFEFLQALIRLFLKIHGETIRRQILLQEKAKRLLELQRSTWQRLDTSFQKARCMITFLSNSQF